MQFVRKLQPCQLKQNNSVNTEYTSIRSVSNKFIVIDYDNDLAYSAQSELSSLKLQYKYTSPCRRAPVQSTQTIEVCCLLLLGKQIGVQTYLIGLRKIKFSHKMPGEYVPVTS